MAEEYQTPCIKPIKELCEDDLQNFWFDAPLRFGLWAFLVSRLPDEVAKFASYQSLSEGDKPKPLQVIESEKEKSILLVDSTVDEMDRFGLVVYNPKTKTTFPTINEAKHKTTIKIRVFTPSKANYDKYDVVDLNIIATVVKRLLFSFAADDVWQFEGVTDKVFENLKLEEIDSSFSDSEGAGVRLEREVCDITITYTYDENLDNLDLR